MDSIERPTADIPTPKKAAAEGIKGVQKLLPHSNGGGLLWEIHILRDFEGTIG